MRPSTLALLFALWALPLAASELPAAPAGVVQYLAGFDGASQTGLFQQVDADGNLVILDRRPGWTLQEIHPVPLDSTQGVLLIWKDFPAQRKTSPELWADGEVIPGFEELSTLNRVWPADEAPVVWSGARHELRVRGGEAKLQVLRDLAAENEEAPLLRKKEVYRLGEADARLSKAKYQPITTPAQRLNKVADLIELTRYEGLKDQLRPLAGAGAAYLQRGAVLMTRVPMNRADWMQSKHMLDAVVMAGGPVAERAAARLFEMTQREWEVGAE